MAGRVPPPARPNRAASPAEDRDTTGPLGDDARPPRLVTSYVRRSGRMTPSQKRAWDMHAHRFVVPVTTLPSGVITDPAALDLRTLFGRDADTVVEIGPGMGESLVAMAAERPEIDIVAFEVYHASVAAIVHKLAQAEVGNVRLVMGDASSGLRRLFGPGSLSEVWTFFPDPWPKTRHRKRRLVSTPFADLVADRLRPGGVWRLATDAAEYATWSREVLDGHPALRNEHLDATGTTSSGWAPRLTSRPVTKFEARGIAEGRTIRDLSYRRV